MSVISRPDRDFHHLDRVEQGIDHYGKGRDTMFYRMQIGVDGILSASIALGNRLQLFQALAKVSSEETPATPAQVAEESGCKERYVKEWLSVMAAGDLITVTEDEKFFIKKEHIAERLEQGGMMCLDVGCGKGFHAAFLAKHFPKSNFTGIDITLEAVHLANQQRKDNGGTFDNLAFIQMDGAKMDPDWTEKFDLVTIFDACHDQMRPDLCLKEIHRVLKPGGVFGMVEVKGHSNIFKNKQEYGPRAAMMYGASTFVCLPVASNSADALGLGAMWGQELALKMLKEAGFTNAHIVPTPFYETSTLYLSTKE
ncbi:methyltransferase domain protein [Ancylostoma ceylanicum]|uniref:Methyltransferase domain protein n=1 Tax=Ancylostoma ceylanicum TaxID=53326 RepID=A0A0D6LS80_9BILA|nr:methyltransferase domain protein [Ancylostoma ceylanicum]